jgi:hypothetical protein
LGAIRGTDGLQHCVGAGVESMLHQILIRFAENFPALSFKCMQIRFQMRFKTAMASMVPPESRLVYRHRVKRADDDSRGRGNVKRRAIDALRRVAFLQPYSTLVQIGNPIERGSVASIGRNRAHNCVYEPCPFYARKAMLHRFNFVNLSRSRYQGAQRERHFGN